MLSASGAPWDLAPHLPWSVFQSPAARWEAMPSFVVGEYAFYVCTLLALVHALRCGRAHLLVWIAALLAGTANDMIFMALPLVDNFWQAQGTIMLTPRLPLYIPCVYICFMYIPTVAVWRLGLPRLGQAALTGLVAELFYGPYDITGAKFLWWTWHDTDMPIANRLLGVPIGSSMWVITFVSTFALLASLALRKDPRAERPATALRLIGFVCLGSTLGMMVQMNLLQPLDGGIPGVNGLIAVIVGYLALAAFGWRRRDPARAPSSPRVDRLLVGAAALHYLTLAAVMACFDPASHRSASMHQTYGPCHVEATDVLGFTRYQYLCAEDYDEDFSFDCVDAPPSDGSEWYTVCGRPHTDFPRWMLTISLLAALGVGCFSYLLLGRRPPRPE
ncbi:MAG: hypothetical protein KC636_33355 [Myxococcales bacterium]|nr:hypothetical protein [Myxococcales bacterium]